MFSAAVVLDGYEAPVAVNLGPQRDRDRFAAVTEPVLDAVLHQLPLALAVVFQVLADVLQVKPDEVLGRGPGDDSLE